MFYPEVKVSFDGSHYIGIKKTTNPCKRRPSVPEEKVPLIEPEKLLKQEPKTDEGNGLKNAVLTADLSQGKQVIKEKKNVCSGGDLGLKTQRMTTKKERLKECVVRRVFAVFCDGYQ